MANYVPNADSIRGLNDHLFRIKLLPVLKDICIASITLVCLNKVTFKGIHNNSS